MSACDGHGTHVARPENRVARARDENHAHPSHTKHDTNEPSTTPTMANSLQIAAPTTSNLTNTLTNAFATDGGADSDDSAATAVKITAKAEHR